MSMETILGGKTAIRNEANAWDIRSQNAPLLDPDTQPNLYRINAEIAKKNGIAVEQLQLLSPAQVAKLK